MGGKQVEGVRGQSGTNWHKHGSCGWCLWFVILQVFQADVPGSKFQGGQRGRKLRRGAVILRIFREHECVANGLKLLVPYFKFLLNI